MTADNRHSRPRARKATEELMTNTKMVPMAARRPASRYGNAASGAPLERLVVTIPIRTVNPLNQRRTWWAVSKQGRTDKSATLLTLRSVHVGAFPLPVVVTLTRISPGKGLDAHDALPASLKHCVDAVAYWLGIDDADTENVMWRYAQERGPWGVRVVVERREAAA